ncbi:MAG: hypothetical protein IJL14_06960 [Selenomonadaceae bacterium]|nr:hypothetical protein [Selenomonadaceae bacterium]
MVILMLGYCLMGLIFLVLRFFYHILPKKRLQNNLVSEVKKDLITLYSYAKQIVVSNPTKSKFIFVIMICLIILPMTPLQIEIEYIFEDFLSTIMFFALVIVFAPQENPTEKGFPVEIFGFIYSIIFMYYSAGLLVFDTFYVIDSLQEDMWIYGYSITMISYVLCIATLSRFMERVLSKIEIIFLGMIMLTTLEFITYYGIGFFGGIKFYNYDPLEYELNLFNMFGDITTIINQGIFIASQSQILERSPSEIWGYIILNGTDVLTVTVVLGYLVQKFMEMNSKD